MRFLVKVTREGQVALPKEIRDALKIGENEYLVVRLEGEKIVIEKPSMPEPGEPVGEEEYSRIIRELEELRNRWR